MNEIVIDTPERVAAAFDIIDDLTAGQGLVTCETIPVMRVIGGRRARGGQLPGGKA